LFAQVWVKKTNDEAWLHARTLSGKVGALPSNYVEITHEDGDDELAPLPSMAAGAKTPGPSRRRRASVQSHRPRSRGPGVTATLKCKALYDYEAVDAADLAFSEGDIMTCVIAAAARSIHPSRCAQHARSPPPLPLSLTPSFSPSLTLQLRNDGQ
jgi:hypothetical protein